MDDVEVGEDSLSSVEAFSSASKRDEDSDSGSDSEEEYAEPKLKYERLSSDLRNLLQKDKASAMAVHQKFLVLGTNGGTIHLLDAMGNILPSRQMQPHSVRVAQLSIDHAGEFYASSSEDGRIVVTGLYTEENTHNFKLDKPVRSIAIDPIYARAHSGRRYMVAIDDKLVMYEKTFLSRYKQDVLCQGEGPISNIKWRGRFAAWLTNKGVRVYDVVDGVTISLIPKPVTAPTHAEVPWRIGWGDQFKLIVSFGSTVKVCVVEKRHPPVDSLPVYLVRVDGVFTLDCLICGVAPLDNLVVVLAVNKRYVDSSVEGVTSVSDCGDFEQDEEERPQLMVFEKSGNKYQLVSTDLLSIRGFESYSPKDYQLEYLVDEKHYFVMSPGDVVVGKPRDKDDNIDWLLQHNQFEKALEEARLHEKLLKRHSVQSLGKKYLEYLIQLQQFEQAGEVCGKILGSDKAAWEEQVLKFAKVKQLKVIAKYMPPGEDGLEKRSHHANLDLLKLDPAFYEMVLFDFLKTDPEGFLSLVRKWPNDLYNTKAIVNGLMDQLRSEPDNATLLRSLATLFTYQRKYEKALDVYLRLRHPDVFQLIKQHRLFKSIQDKIPALMDLNTDEALKLLLEYQAEIPADLVVNALTGRSKQLFLYLDSLYSREKKECPGKFQGLLVKLYADFAPNKLLNFLKSSDQYPIQEALEECELRGMTPERIYLLARMGNTRAALELIIREMADIEQAVDFCKEHDDMELWYDIIKYSLDKPIFINYLLHNIGTHIDPRILVERIEPGMKIDGLRDSLIQILRDYNLQVSLQEGCKKILVSDSFSLLQRKVRLCSKGLLLSDGSLCHVCGSTVFGKEQDKMRDVMVFNCRHAFHSDCLTDSAMCLVCCRSGRHVSNYAYLNND